MQDENRSFLRLFPVKLALVLGLGLTPVAIRAATFEPQPPQVNGLAECVSRQFVASGIPIRSTMTTWSDGRIEGDLKNGALVAVNFDRSNTASIRLSASAPREEAVPLRAGTFVKLEGLTEAVNAACLPAKHSLTLQR